MKQTKSRIKISVVESNQHVDGLYHREGFVMDSHNKLFKYYLPVQAKKTKLKLIKHAETKSAFVSHMMVHIEDSM